MIQVKINNGNLQFPRWLIENIGEFDIDWKWSDPYSGSYSVDVKDPEKAVFVALNWT